jgi:hypothetical protein
MYILSYNELAITYFGEALKLYMRIPWVIGDLSISD